MTRRHVVFNNQGFVLNGHRHIKWNLFDHCFREQLMDSIEGLDFSTRKFVVEIELIEPRTKVTYLLRYLTLNQLTPVTYPKIYVTIMQHLRSKRRPLHMFDCQG